MNGACTHACTHTRDANLWHEEKNMLRGESQNFCEGTREEKAVKRAEGVSTANLTMAFLLRRSTITSVACSPLIMTSWIKL